MSSIYLPQLYAPNGTEARVLLKVALVDSTNRQLLFGFEGVLGGYAGESTFTLDGNSDTLELPANATLVPDSLWRFTLEHGTQVETHYVDLADDSAIALVDLLYGAPSS
jgi:hypothetical protein